MTTTKITGLTGMNRAALEEAMEKGILTTEVHLTKTTATFPGSPHDAARMVDDAKVRFIIMGRSSRSHPVSSLNAVIRKAKAQRPTV